MKPVFTHPWNLTESEALILQKDLAKKVIKEDMLSNINYIAGVDVAYAENIDRQIAAVVILNAKTLEVVETSIAEDVTNFPYIPGLFSFRELPSIIKALSTINTKPDLIVCDGQGIAHPRRFGLASHLGVLFDVPTIGCGKTRLHGQAEEPGLKRGDYAPLIDNGEIIGNKLRTQDNIKPVYVSIGHRISLKLLANGF
ncbi:deoxyribonuclease V [Acetivibrio clariflavus]|uniref:deoxyribonuclease V n=1 Tax=Acetivibrio clariflavus TaxID=288965 RepID=UPI0031F49AC2